MPVLLFHPLCSEGCEGCSGVGWASPLELGWGSAFSFQWRQPSLDVEVGDPNPDVVSFRSTWTKYIQENKQKWKERAASGGCRPGGRGLQGGWLMEQGQAVSLKPGATLV